MLLFWEKKSEVSKLSHISGKTGKVVTVKRKEHFTGITEYYWQDSGS